MYGDIYGADADCDPFAALDALEEMVATSASPVLSLVEGCCDVTASPSSNRVSKVLTCSEMFDNAQYELHKAGELPERPRDVCGSTASAEALVGAYGSVRSDSPARGALEALRPAGSAEYSWDDSEEGIMNAELRGLYQRQEEMDVPSLPNAGSFDGGRASATLSTARDLGDNDLDDLVGELLAESPINRESLQMVHGFHCVGCDSQVLRVEDCVWDGSVEYLFFRNKYPVFEALSSGLCRQECWAAYCCKCSWTSVPNDVDLYDVAEGLNWRVIT